MATVAELEGRGALRRHDPNLDWRDQEVRAVYALPSAANWIAVDIAAVASRFSHDLTPCEQADNLLANFCAGQSMAIPRQMRLLRHIMHGVWELKTLEVRLFGWFYRKDIFICASCALADDVKQNALYEHHRDIVVAARDALDLDEPKFIPGEDPDDVISNFYSS